MKNMFRFLFTMCGLVTASMLLAQQDSLSNYACDFEDPVQNATWHFPTIDKTQHQWTIGQAVNNGGSYSMYVTPKGQDTTCYINKDAIVYAYVDLTLEKSSEKFILSFDWMGVGYVPNKRDGLYVFWVPDNDDLGRPITFEDQDNSSIPDLLAPYALELNPALGDNALRGKSSWQAWISNNSTQSDSRLRGGQHRRLVFAWLNTSDGPVNPGACIDNINIVDGRACAAPSKLLVTTAGEDSLILNWKGEESALYEVGCYSYEKKEWKTLRVDTNYYVFQNVPEGYTDFYVRSVCYDEGVQKEYFSAKSQDSKFIYYPANHCIDYITMTDDNCFTNTEDTKVSVVHDIDKVKWVQGIVSTDDPKTSRHTLCTSKVEIDPNTTNTTDGAMLKMVPAGELASVRLGNWNTGGEAERVEFNFHVDVNVNPILVMKYAVVLQHPGESCIPNPGFRLRVLKKAGKKAIANKCAMADFDYKAAADKDWHMSFPGGSSTDVRWKDWTTIGINLSEYDGEDLIIQLTTYDCGGGGHYGYAYFTLGCAKDKLDGMNCDGKPATDFYAPAGFKYRWYLAADETKTPLGEEQHFFIDSLDSKKYSVDVIFPEDSDCYFTLNASSQPHYAVPEMSYKHTPHDCRNFITIQDLSRTETITLKTHDTIRTPVDWLEWDYGVGIGAQIPNGEKGEIEFPAEGGVFPIIQYASTENCTFMTTTMVTIPAIGEQKTDTTVYRCPGTSYQFVGYNADGKKVINPNPYTEPGIYQDTLVASTDCDSIIVTDFRILIADTTGKQQVILQGDTAYFHDRPLTVSGIYRDTARSVYGCDSIIDTLDLYVHEFLEVQMLSYDSICAGDGEWKIAYRFIKGHSCGSYSLTWPIDHGNSDLPVIDKEDLPADYITVAMPNQVNPDYYTAHFIFHDSLRYLNPEKIKDYELDVRLGVQYSDSIIAQRWNDVLAVRNSDFNGGFSFSDYQWYMNGQKLEGETGSYLYRPLEMDKEYQVQLTRALDGVTLFSCPVTPVQVDPQYDVPTIVSVSASVPLRGQGKATWVNTVGNNCGTQVYNDSPVIAPAQGGIYMLLLQTEHGKSTHRIIVR